MKTKNILGFALLGTAYFIFKNKKSIPDGVEAVKDFKAEKYLGLWHEIARMPEFFERGLNKAIAEYSLNADKTIKVVNRGYSPKKAVWKQSEGVAKFTKNVGTAELKVSFFRPFWAGYNVIAIDENYQYALVSGDTRNHLWLLSRTSQIPEHVKRDFLNLAQEAGFPVSKLIWAAV